jgi:BirA family biotin operon repressor/biotin-[acetyl-CoA-carboxylase] ligase
MNQDSLEAALVDLNLPDIRFFQSVGSTNDEASKWIEAGAPHLGFIIADEQTAGRGRSMHHWVSAPGTCLAFSLILLSPPFDSQYFSRLSGLGAIAVRGALQRKYSLPVQVKWPNDILLNQKKAGGVLVEAHWNGDYLKAVIIGIGINIAPESITAVNLAPPYLNFPATCIESSLGYPVDRLELLHAILHELLFWLPRISIQDFIREWESSLAFRDQWVELSYTDTPTNPQNRTGITPTEVGKVIGLTQDGSIKIVTKAGKLVTDSVGEIHIRPAVTGQSLPPLD